MLEKLNIGAFLLLITLIPLNLPAQVVPSGSGPATGETTGDEIDREFDEGSKIEAIALNKQTVKSLDLLGRVWGFVKYHHPAVARGEYNWDYELFRVMPKYLKADSDEARYALLVKWIEGLGKFDRRPEDTTEGNPDYALRPDVKWIEGLQSKKLAELLTALQDAERPDTHSYVGWARRVGNPEFYEEPYEQFEYPDTGYRLLALFRHWNIVQYYFPYRDLTDKDWNNVLTEFIPKFVNAGDALEYRLVLMELVGTVQDTHAQLQRGDEITTRFRGVNLGNMVVRFIEGKLMVMGYPDAELAEESGATFGDIITAIDGVFVEDWIKEKGRYFGASNEASLRKVIAENILRTNNESLSLTVEREKKSQTVTVPALERRQMVARIKEWRTKPEAWQDLDGNIGYWHTGSLKGRLAQTPTDERLQMRGWVIDLRCYPSQQMMVSTSYYLMPFRTETWVPSKGVPGEPGAFAFQPPRLMGSDNPRRGPFLGKIAILVDERTLSQAEFTALIFRASPQAKVFGGTTAGADGNVSPFKLPGNIGTGISGIGVFTLKKEHTQRLGIIPDVRVEPTIAGVRAGRDEVLEKALEWIRAEDQNDE